MDEFSQLDEHNSDQMTPGRKRLLSNYEREEINWDFNQDYEASEFIQKGTRVFHQKFGYGKIIYIDEDKADVVFDKSSQKQIFLKYLKFMN